jgi:hypothetical protein
MEEQYYNNFTISTANQFGTTVYIVRPSEYAHQMWGEDHGDQFGELGQEFWADVYSIQDAEAMIDAFVADLDSREVA